MSDYDFNPPAVVNAAPPARRSSWIQKAILGPRRIEPRKGQNPRSLAGTQGLYGQSAASHWKQPESHLVQRKRWLSIPGYSLEELANRDDIIFSIRSTLKRAIGEMDWSVVPDLDKIKADLKRWQNVTFLRLAHPSFPITFEPQVISPEFFLRAQGELRNLIQDEFGQALIESEQSGKPGGVEFNPDSNLRLREFFERCLQFHEAVAESHINVVAQCFDHPNPSAESSFRALLNRIIDDLTVFDAACLVKNPRLDGTPGELYTIPGSYIRVYQCDDLSTPRPPYAAYDWFQDAKIRAMYNNVEMIYMMMNPQNDGYGKPPMEVLLEQMVGSLYGDAYLVDQFQNNNLPFFVFDLGPNVNQDERDAMEAAWDNRVRRGQHRGIFVASKEDVKGFIPMPTASNKDNEILELLKHWAARKCAAFGLSLNDIGFTEDLHRTTADTQKDLTQARGIVSMAKAIQGYLNGEFVQGSMWVRDDPLDPNCQTGRQVPCFPFKDVKFQFEEPESEEDVEEAQRAVTLIDAGVLTRNEVRKEMNLPPREGGDILVLKGSAGELTRVEDLTEISLQQQREDAKAEASAKGGGEGGDGAPKPPGSDTKPPQPSGSGGQPGGEGGSPENDVEKRLRKLADALATRLES